jgi:hypothetical protein
MHWSVSVEPTAQEPCADGAMQKNEMKRGSENERVFRESTKT